jgi:hypothetical protein
MRILTTPIILAAKNEAKTIPTSKCIDPNFTNPPNALKIPMGKSVRCGTLNNMAKPIPAIPAAILFEIIISISISKA